MPDPDRIVALALLTEKEWRSFAADLKPIFLVPADRAFDDLLAEVARVIGSQRR
jgi:hypothetical protein